jgi:amidohydrolase
MHLEDLKKAIISDIESQRVGLIELCLKIHSNPEIALKEYKAVEWLTYYLQCNGFSNEKGIVGLDTAFRSVYGKGKPFIAFLAEYDALPGIGHACGHNIIAASAVGAAVAARIALQHFPGSIVVMGTPAEELQGGKITLVEREAFKDIDIAMMVHPGIKNSATTQALACQNLEIAFHGKAAHAAANPETGINALEAMIVSFNAVNSLRQHIKPTSHIHGIITNGGEAANIVPAYSAAMFMVRAGDDAYLEELKPRVLDCFKGGALATGARLEYKWGTFKYSAMRNNMALAELFQVNMQLLGRKMDISEPYTALGSTDMGNVSQIKPSIHPVVQITPEDISTHSVEFAQVAASEQGMIGMLDSAKAMAMTAVDLLASSEALNKVKAEFDQNG